MTHNPSPDWYDRHVNNKETYTSIAKTARVSRNRVAGAINRYRDELVNPKPKREPREAPKPKPKVETPTRRSKAKRQAVHPDALARFDRESKANTCLWVQGDLRDGQTEVCGMRRSHKTYCADHHAKVYDQRPRKPVKAP